jgi:hypothetical protein
MNSNGNKQLMQAIFSELAEGNDSLFIHSMSDDIEWSWMSTQSWARSFKGRDEVIGELWASVKRDISPPFTAIAQNIIAEGEYVVVEAIGKNTTPDGKVYNNKYCWVCRLHNSKINQIKEYMDTELVAITFGG